jgi:Cytochrome P460
MKSKTTLAIAVATAALAVLGGTVVIAQDSRDKYSVKVPGGLAFAEFKGYEGWQAVAISHPGERQLLNVIVANPTMIEAYRAGIPGNGRPFPDGSRMAKLAYTPRQHPNAPFPVKVPDQLSGIGFMVKDSSRFPDTGGWGYAQFEYDAAAGSFSPNTAIQANDAKCGAACHSIARPRDYVFTEYAKR